jgi:hypothetical protein
VPDGLSRIARIYWEYGALSWPPTMGRLQLAPVVVLFVLTPRLAGMPSSQRRTRCRVPRRTPITAPLAGPLALGSAGWFCRGCVAADEAPEGFCGLRLRCRLGHYHTRHRKCHHTRNDLS